MKPWTERIPAAIAKGERLTAERGYYEWPTLRLTAGEVALAKACYQWHPDPPFCADSGCLTGPTLIAYTEKIERLSHD